MENIKCDRCQGPTKPKQITSKKDGKTYTLMECQGSCMAGKFKYSFFPPKTNGNGQVSGSANAVLEELRAIRKILEYLLNNPKKQSNSELQPDENLPF